MEGKIYKITNLINGKVYIGQTIQTLKQRWWRHCCNSGVCPYLHNAILKYGKENFTIELITEVNKDLLDLTEKYYISLYKSNNKHFGYNLTEGGSRAGTRAKALSEREEQKVIRLKENGWSSKELAKKFNVDKSTIRNIFTRHNRILPNKRNLECRVNLKDFEKFIINNHPTYKEIENKFGICKCSIYNLLHKLNNPLLKIDRKKRISNAEYNALEVIKLYRDGYNINDLTKVFHCNKKYISKVLHNAGVPIQKDKRSIEYNISKSVQTLTS